jgi:hypothetical protein
MKRKDGTSKAIHRLQQGYHLYSICQGVELKGF